MPSSRPAAPATRGRFRGGGSGGRPAGGGVPGSRVGGGPGATRAPRAGGGAAGGGGGGAGPRSLASPVHGGQDGSARGAGDGSDLCGGEAADVHQGDRDALDVGQGPERGRDPAAAEPFERGFGRVRRVRQVRDRPVVAGGDAAGRAAEL